MEVISETTKDANWSLPSTRHPHVNLADKMKLTACRWLTMLKRCVRRKRTTVFPVLPVRPVRPVLTGRC